MNPNAGSAVVAVLRLLLFLNLLVLVVSGLFPHALQRKQRPTCCCCRVNTGARKVPLKGKENEAVAGRPLSKSYD